MHCCLKQTHFSGNRSRSWIPILEFDEFHKSVHNQLTMFERLNSMSDKNQITSKEMHYRDIITKCLSKKTLLGTFDIR